MIAAINYYNLNSELSNDVLFQQKSQCFCLI